MEMWTLGIHIWGINGSCHHPNAVFENPPWKCSFLCVGHKEHLFLILHQFDPWYSIVSLQQVLNLLHSSVKTNRITNHICFSKFLLNTFHKILLFIIKIDEIHVNVAKFGLYGSETGAKTLVMTHFPLFITMAMSLFSNLLKTHEYMCLVNASKIWKCQRDFMQLSRIKKVNYSSGSQQVGHAFATRTSSFCLCPVKNDKNMFKIL